jgi:hypothetical protein
MALMMDDKKKAGVAAVAPCAGRAVSRWPRKSELLGEEDLLEGSLPLLRSEWALKGANRFAPRLSVVGGGHSKSAPASLANRVVVW